MSVPSAQTVLAHASAIIHHVTLPRLLAAISLTFAPLLLFRAISPQPSPHHHLSLDLNTWTVQADLHILWLGVVPVAGYLLIVLLTMALGVDDGENVRQNMAQEARMTVWGTLVGQIFANAGVALLFHGGGLSIAGVLRGMFALDTIEYFTHRLFHEVLSVL